MTTALLVFSALLILLALIFLVMASANQVPLWPAVLCVVLERLLALGMRILAVLAVLVWLATPAEAQLTLGGRELAAALAVPPALQVLEPPSPEELWLIAGVVIAGGLDTWSTVTCIHQGTCREANALLNLALTTGEAVFLITKAISTAALAYLTHYLFKSGHPRWGRGVAWIAIGTWGTAAALNSRYLRPERLLR